MSRRLPISLVRAGIQMAQTKSKKEVAEQLLCSKALISKWRRKFRAAGCLFSEIDKLSDENLRAILYARPKRFFPWQSDEELYREFEQSNLSIRAFYSTIYLAKVPEGEKSMSLDSFYLRLRPRQKCAESESSTRATSNPNVVQCFDLSDKVSVVDCAPSEINQVRITLANGTSIAFYPGSASEAFVIGLLRQNGVRI